MQPTRLGFGSVSYALLLNSTQIERHPTLARLRVKFGELQRSLCRQLRWRPLCSDHIAICSARRVGVSVQRLGNLTLIVASSQSG